ncbi:DUF4199 domain-containing protein [Tenacibaculum bernardetii]|uniref:DUF4199 domain-containing protein n=1 Tax=Tenacibaculum bernardetii TaxID=3021375 RepID=UPI0023AF088B|nr:DUF4199 domain-containing protein [Tenacibaculum bernardetii]
MENQANSKNIILNYGLYLGGVCSIVHLAIWATGNLIELNWINSLVWFIALIVFLVIGIKKFKEGNNNFMSWGQGLKIGMGIAMISGVISVIYTLLFMNVIDPGFQQIAMEAQQQAWLDGGLTEEQVENFTESAKNFQSPAMIGALILGMSAFFGFIISAITAAIMKNNEEEQY